MTYQDSAVGTIDFISGGFPCQDISGSGHRKGIKPGTRSGLWSEFCRIISEIQPQFALIENVPDLLVRGLDRVLCDLAEIGLSQVLVDFYEERSDFISDLTDANLHVFPVLISRRILQLGYCGKSFSRADVTQKALELVNGIT